MRDLDWLIPSIGLTIVLGAVAALPMLVIGYSAPPDPLLSLTGWCGLTWTISGATVVLYTIRLMKAGNQRPMVTLVANLRSDWRRYALIIAGMMLAGLDQYFFMILKPELDWFFPFWADPMLSRLDRLVFGIDPWRLFATLDLEVMAWIYSPLWFGSVLVTLFWVFLQAPSQRKSSAIICYFSLWSVFGPLGQTLASSAGPIFYERIGLGNRYGAMELPTVTRILSDYLWTAYRQRSLAPGAGISAMPSLHIATMVWVVLSLASFRSRWVIPMLGLSLYIYVGSIALGWHYAADGIVGAAGCVVLFQLINALLRRRSAIAEPKLELQSS